MGTSLSDEEIAGYKSAYLYLVSFQQRVGPKPLQLPPEGFDTKDIDKHFDDIRTPAQCVETVSEESKVLQQELLTIEKGQWFV